MDTIVLLIVQEGSGVVFQGLFIAMEFVMKLFTTLVFAMAPSLPITAKIVMETKSHVIF
jgi:hypothetical protein